MEGSLINVHIDIEGLSRVCSESYFIYAYVFQAISKKKTVAEISTAVLATFLDKSKCMFSSYKISYKFVLVPSFYFSEDQKQESGFQQAGSLVKKLIYICCLCRALFNMRGVSN